MEIELIKQKVSIEEMADKFGANPSRSGKCKFNPLREEKTSSLHIYPQTNTYTDFGNPEGGSSVIDFYMNATGKDFSEAVKDLKDFANITPEVKVVKRTYKKDYMDTESVDKAFNNPFWEDINLNKKEQLKHLLTVAPEWLFHEAQTEDKKDFSNIAKYSKNLKTSIYKLPNEDGNFYTFKYRYYTILDEVKKWVSLAGSKADYSYCRFKESEYLLIVEGTRDFLTALLCGYNVMAIPRAGFENINQDLLANKKVIFLDDDDDRGFMKPLYEQVVTKKYYFEHNEFKKITKCKSKDFSDYLYQFKNLKEFKEAFDKFISDNKFKDVNNWQDNLSNSKTMLTLETLQNAPEVETLIDGFIFKGTATLLHSKPGQGKSTLLLGLLKKMINENKIDNFIYFDADNPMSVLKSRLSKLTDIFKERMIYHSHTLGTVQDLRDEMGRLCLYNQQGANTVVVIDTLGNFVTSANNDDEVKEIMDIVRNLRDKFGATVFVVHHSNKSKDENNNVVFRGSTNISAVVDFMWGIQRKQNTVTLKNDKGRFEYFEKIEADVDLANYDVEFNGSYQYEEYEEQPAEKEPEEVTAAEVINYLANQKDWVTISKIQKHFGYHRSKDKRDFIFNCLKEDTGVELDKKGRGWSAFYTKTEPKVVEYDMKEVESIFGSVL